MMQYLALIGLGGGATTLPEPLAEHLLLDLRAVEMLYNQWLFVSDLSAEQIGERIWPLMNSDTDTLVVLEAGRNQFIRNVNLDAASSDPLFRSARPKG